jgi:hypothetical protein
VAYKLTLSPNPWKLPFIWNVSQHVGDKASSANRPTDVELVCVLIQSTLSGGHVSGRTPGVMTSPLPLGGRFDAVLGYWIYSFQANQQGKPDGVVSPAKALGDPMLWLVARMNIAMRNANPTAWEALDRLPTLSGALRAELGRNAP